MLGGDIEVQVMLFAVVPIPGRRSPTARIFPLWRPQSCLRGIMNKQCLSPANLFEPYLNSNCSPTAIYIPSFTFANFQSSTSKVLRFKVREFTGRLLWRWSGGWSALCQIRAWPSLYTEQCSHLQNVYANRSYPVRVVRNLLQGYNRRYRLREELVLRILRF